MPENGNGKSFWMLRYWRELAAAMALIFSLGVTYAKLDAIERRVGNLETQNKAFLTRDEALLMREVAETEHRAMERRIDALEGEMDKWTLRRSRTF